MGAFLKNPLPEEVIKSYLKPTDILNTWLTIRLNLPKLVGKPKTELFTEDDTEELFYNFDYIVNNLGAGQELPLSSDYYFNRIDYAVDVHTVYKTETLNLLNKTGYNSYFLDPKGTYKTSIELKNNSYSINIYDKLEERLNEKQHQENTRGYTTISQNELDTVSDILRVELQCMTPKLRAMQHKYKLSSYRFTENTDYLKEDTARSVINDTLRARLGTADYYKLDYLKEEELPRIFKTEKTQEQVYNLLKWISQKGHTVESAKTDYKELSKDTICRYYRTLRHAGIEPATLQARIKNTYKLSGISNLYVVTEIEQNIT